MINPSNNMYYIPEDTEEEKQYFRTKEKERRQLIYDLASPKLKPILSRICFTEHTNYYNCLFPLGHPVYIKIANGNIRQDYLVKSLTLLKLINPLYSIEIEPQKLVFEELFKLKRSSKKITLNDYGKTWAFSKRDFD